MDDNDDIFFTHCSIEEIKKKKRQVNQNLRNMFQYLRQIQLKCIKKEMMKLSIESKRIE